MSQKKVSELKAQLQILVTNEEFVRLRKEELKEKSKKCDELESENESLKRSLEIMVWMYMYLLYSYFFFSPPIESFGTV
jgi:cell shape-determining protein MreC